MEKEEITILRAQLLKKYQHINGLYISNESSLESDFFSNMTNFYKEAVAIAKEKNYADKEFYKKTIKENYHSTSFKSLFNSFNLENIQLIQAIENLKKGKRDINSFLTQKNPMKGNSKDFFAVAQGHNGWNGFIASLYTKEQTTNPVFLDDFHQPMQTKKDEININTVQGDVNITIHFDSKQKYLSTITEYPYFTGRRKELQEINQAFTKHKLVYINGEHGVGKSALVNEYIVENDKIFDKILWIDFQENMMYSFINNPVFPIFLPNHSTTDPKSYYQAILNYLTNVKGNNKLLVIDNLDNAQAIQDVFKSREIFLNGWNVIITSICNSKTVNNTITIRDLPRDEAKELFHKICNQEDKVLFEKTLGNKTSYSPYEVEFFAHAVRQLYRKSQFLEKEIDFSMIKDEKVTTQYFKLKSDTTFYNSLSDIFRDEILLKDIEKQFLLLYSYLPNNLKNLCVIKTLFEGIYDTDKIDSLISQFYDEGWISKDYQMHHLRQEYILNSIHHSFNDIEILFKNLFQQLEVKETDNPIEKFYYIPIATSFLEKAEKQNFSNHLIYAIYHKTGIIEFDSGNLNQSLLLQKKASHSKEKNLLRDIYFDIGLVYERQGDYKHSIQFLLKSNAILNEDKFSKITGLAKISVVYRKLFEVTANTNDSKKSIEFAEQTINFIERLTAQQKESTVVATAYIDVAVTFHKTGQQDKFGYFEKGIAIFLKKLNTENHPWIATSYNLYANALRDNGQTDLAIVYYQKALSIRELIYSSHSNHYSLAESYSDIALIHFMQNDMEKAEFYVLKALAIRRVIFSEYENHPRLKESEDLYINIKNKTAK